MSLLGAAGLAALTSCGRSDLDEGEVGRVGGSGADPDPMTGGRPNPRGGAAGTSSAGTSTRGGTPGQGGAASGGTSQGGMSGGGAGEGGATSSECAANVETTIGPFPNLGPLERRDVRGNTSGDTTPKLGAPLTLRVRVLDLDAFCAPIEGAFVEIWQCDAVGAYAGYAAFGTVGQDFCRGAQKTDAQGVAALLTIFPGSYAGRALHIHFSIREATEALPANVAGSNLTEVFVAQLYFDAAVAAQIFAAYPVYQQGATITPNESDALYVSGGGQQLLVSVMSSGNGYVGEVTVGVRRSEIGL